MNKALPYTFGGLEKIPLSSAKFILLPVPYESTVSFKPGTRFGPESILLSSRYMELYDEETDSEPWRNGILTLPEIVQEIDSTGKMMKKISSAAKKIIEKDKFLFVLGGEHSISFPVVKEYKKKYSDLKVIHFDAHADLRIEYEGSRSSHACVMRRISELGCEIFSFGIRSISKEEKDALSGLKNIHINFAHTCRNQTLIDKASSIPEGNYYISIDVDCFDPSVVPDTGTVEPGGLTWYEVTGFLKKFIAGHRVVGADLVELSPSNHYCASSFMAAKLIYKIIAYLTAKN
ncbi:MAG: agmatinase [Candidatus Omnitrophica bacterium]|nr:agmatinase [Candidatus Omnitrophota bacterium]MCM8825243.1 agmatinase [Candidatus Omnitrophota bacterium]